MPYCIAEFWIPRHPIFFLTSSIFSPTRVPSIHARELARMHSYLAFHVHGKSMKIHARTDDRPEVGAWFRKHYRHVYTAYRYVLRCITRRYRRSYVAKPRRTSRCGRSSRGNSRRDSLRNLWKALGKLSLRGFRSKTVFRSRVRIHTCIKSKFEPCQACSFSASGLFLLQLA